MQADSSVHWKPRPVFFWEKQSLVITNPVSLTCVLEFEKVVGLPSGETHLAVIISSVAIVVVQTAKFVDRVVWWSHDFSQCCFHGLHVSFWSCRVIPQRFSRPMEYRLYLELLKRHGFSFHYQMKAANFRKWVPPWILPVVSMRSMYQSVISNENLSHKCSDRYDFNIVHNNIKNEFQFKVFVIIIIKRVIPV